MDFNINLKLGVNKMKYTVTENLLIELYQNKKQKEELKKLVDEINFIENIT